MKRDLTTLTVGIVLGAVIGMGLGPTLATAYSTDPAQQTARAVQDIASTLKSRDRLNSIRLSGLYAHQFLRERTSATTGEPLETQENFGGFEIAYQWDLIEDHLAIELSKPFVFSGDTFESPFEVTLEGLFVKGP